MAEEVQLSYKMTLPPEVEEQISVLKGMTLEQAKATKVYVKTVSLSGKDLWVVMGRSTSLGPYGLYLMVGFPDMQAEVPADIFLNYEVLSGADITQAMSLTYAVAERLDPEGVGSADLNFWGMTWMPSFHIHLRLISVFGKQWQVVVRTVFDARAHRAALEAHLAALAALQEEMEGHRTPASGKLEQAISRLVALQESFQAVVAAYVKELKPVPPKEE